MDHSLASVLVGGAGDGNRSCMASLGSCGSWRGQVLRLRPTGLWGSAGEGWKPVFRRVSELAFGACDRAATVADGPQSQDSSA
jgi:hypothetical protein